MIDKAHCGGFKWLFDVPTAHGVSLHFREENHVRKLVVGVSSRVRVKPALPQELEIFSVRSSLRECLVSQHFSRDGKFSIRA